MPDGVFEALVLTAEAALLRADARAVVLRSSDGDLTVLDGHTPLITDVVPGDVRVDQAEGDPIHLAVHGGYLQVETGDGVAGTEGRATRVTLLAGTAELASDIDVPRAEQARSEAAARVEELRAVTGRSGGAGGGAGPGARGSAAGGEPATGEPAPSTPEEIELAEAEAALRRAEVRLEVAGAAV
jgi:F-type H+-transporting ATPase subunit epsilon